MASQEVSRRADTIALVACLCVAVIFMAMRAGARWFKSRRVPMDAEDIFMYVALASFAIMSALYLAAIPTFFNVTAIAEGRIQPYANLPHDLVVMLKEFFVVQFFFWLTLWAVKWSLLSMFRRTTEGLPLYNRIWWAVLVFSILTFLGCCISNFTSCSSMHAWFTAGDCTTLRDARAKNISLWFSLAADLATDLLIMITPLRVLWTLKMSLIEKISIAIVFLVGLITMVTAIIRSVSLESSVNSGQVSTTWLMLWAAIEGAVAIVVGCLPSFAIFIRGRVAASRAHNQGSSNQNSFSYYSRTRSRKPPGSVHLEEDNDLWHGQDSASNKSLVEGGFPMCYGVFQNYYSKEFIDSTASIALIGTLAQGLCYLGAPASAILTKRFPRYQRQQIWIGWPMCILGLLTASFATSVNGLIVTQGLLYGLGFVTLTYPIISMINEWWVARKGMAFGLISASSGATGAVMPFIIEALLNRYGYQIALRACAIAMVVLTGPLIPLFRGRLPTPEHASLARIDLGFLKKPQFWIYGSSILIQGIGFFFPVVFLPSYASDIGLSSFNGALLLALMSISQVLGQLFFGYLSDKNLSVTLLATFASVAAAAAALTLWGLGKSMALLVVFAIVYGFFGFGFGTLRVAMGRAVSDDPSTIFATYAVFVFLQGIGNILVGPTSSALMESKTIVHTSYASGRYGGVVILTGVSSAVAAVVLMSWHFYKRLV
ncbi:Fc.00g081340.m01.CDS01 [Cosmosporella sp. VM-42]